MKVVYVETDRCIACLNCVRACVLQQAAADNGTCSNISVMVDFDKRRIVAMTCAQCEDAPCMEACPAKALHRDALTDAVVVDRTRCVGCGLCVSACPNDSLHLDQSQRTAAKCDLCGGRPKCVQVCMAQALHFGDMLEIAELRRRDRNLRIALRAVPRCPEDIQ
jgi:anaerobic carbon-monoxide dehydrogenase iron sulfur subunit